jgi:hypothetical protein
MYARVHAKRARSARRQEKDIALAYRGCRGGGFLFHEVSMKRRRRNQETDPGFTIPGTDPGTDWGPEFGSTVDAPPGFLQRQSLEREYLRLIGPEAIVDFGDEPGDTLIKAPGNQTIYISDLDDDDLFCRVRALKKFRRQNPFSYPAKYRLLYEWDDGSLHIEGHFDSLQKAIDEGNATGMKYFVLDNETRQVVHQNPLDGPVVKVGNSYHIYGKLGSMKRFRPISGNRFTDRLIDAEIFYISDEKTKSDFLSLIQDLNEQGVFEPRLVRGWHDGHKPNPLDGMTAKGRRMYEEVKAAGTATAPSAVVYAAAKRGVPGLVKKRRAKSEPNPDPRDLNKGIDKYAEFHDYEPIEIGQFHKSFKIPAQVNLLGEAVHVLYKSDKWGDKGIDYIHEHEGRVKVGTPDGDGRSISVPTRLRKPKTLVKLGECLGFCFKNGDGEEIEAKGTRPYPELYTTPDGRGLFVVQNKRQCLAVIWGGDLGVEAAGIVG